MKSMHRTKALEAYSGARLLLKSDMAYPSYMMLKESVRGILCYILENDFHKDISEKMKLSRALSLSDHVLQAEEIDCVKQLIEIEQMDFSDILVVDIDKLRNIKSTVKRMINTYLGERV